LLTPGSCSPHRRIVRSFSIRVAESAFLMEAEMTE
jgi:hypothetical protein